MLSLDRGQLLAGRQLLQPKLTQRCQQPEPWLTVGVFIPLDQTPVEQRCKGFEGAIRPGERRKGFKVAAAGENSQAAEERLLMGLRTLEGVPLAQLEPLDLAKLADLAEAGLVREDGRLPAGVSPAPPHLAPHSPPLHSPPAQPQPFGAVCSVPVACVGWSGPGISTTAPGAALFARACVSEADCSAGSTR